MSIKKVAARVTGRSIDPAGASAALAAANRPPALPSQTGVVATEPEHTLQPTAPKEVSEGAGASETTGQQGSPGEGEIATATDTGQQAPEGDKEPEKPAASPPDATTTSQASAAPATGGGALFNELPPRQPARDPIPPVVVAAARATPPQAPPAPVTVTEVRAPARNIAADSSRRNPFPDESDNGPPTSPNGGQGSTQAATMAPFDQPEEVWFEESPKTPPPPPTPTQRWRTPVALSGWLVALCFALMAFSPPIRRWTGLYHQLDNLDQPPPSMARVVEIVETAEAQPTSTIVDQAFVNRVNAAYPGSGGTPTAWWSADGNLPSDPSKPGFSCRLELGQVTKRRVIEEEKTYFFDVSRCSPYDPPAARASR